jgi:hypothetical protein
MASRTLVAAVSAASVATAGWVAFRLYVRSRLVEELDTKYGYADLVRQLRSIERIGLPLKIPTTEELAEAAVPLWATVMPEESMADIIDKGRQSPYWPEAYRTGSSSERLEPYLLAGFRKSQQPGAGKAALLTGTTEALVRSLYTAATK